LPFSIDRFFLTWFISSFKCEPDLNLFSSCMNKLKQAYISANQTQTVLLSFVNNLVCFYSPDRLWNPSFLVWPSCGLSIFRWSWSEAHDQVMRFKFPSPMFREIKTARTRARGPELCFRNRSESWPLSTRFPAQASACSYRKNTLHFLVRQIATNIFLSKNKWILGNNKAMYIGWEWDKIEVLGIWH